MTSFNILCVHWVATATMEAANRSLARSQAREDYLDGNGATRRLSRVIALRSLPNLRYNRWRRALRHKGAYLPIILEAC